MKYYVFDGKGALSLAHKEEGYEDIILQVLVLSASILNCGGNNKCAFYHEELVLVAKEAIEERLQKYVNKRDRFIRIASGLIKDSDGYKEFYDVGVHTIVDLLLGSYRVVEDFDDKLRVVKEQQIINPIAHILREENK